MRGERRRGPDVAQHHAHKRPHVVVQVILRRPRVVGDDPPLEVGLSDARSHERGWPQALRWDVVSDAVHAVRSPADDKSLWVPKSNRGDSHTFPPRDTVVEMGYGHHVGQMWSKHESPELARIYEPVCNIRYNRNMSVRTIIEPLASITHGGDVIDYILDAEGLNYGSLVDSTAGIQTDQGANDWYEVHLVDESDRGIIRYIEVGASGDSSAFSDVKRHLKRYGSPMDELFTVIAYREADTGPLTSPLTEDLTFLQVDNQLSSEDVEVTFDLSYFTVKRYGVEPAYLDYLDDLTVASGQGRHSLEEDIMDVFSIREITRSFYRDFGRIFRDDLQGTIHGLVDPEENLNAYTRVVVNRVLFLMFVEEKGWLDGDVDYIENRYEQVAGDDDLHVYHDFFEPLFFEALSQEGTTESQRLGRIPFLNGGLFERSEIERNVRIDEAFFDKLLSPQEGDDGAPEGFLRRYKISLRESNPSEQELVVDPEFIGRIFEMFMQEGERSEVGAFYTPKPVTSFMTKNGLIYHLLGQTDISHKEAVSLVSDHIAPDSLTGDQIDNINHVLRSTTILDPAVGSGAFIIAMLEELVAISEALDDITGDDRSRFRLKEDFIADTLYGVDIDAGGIELCKFRVWLHLMQDLDLDHGEFLDSNEQFALPNLGFKFFVGNSLVGEHDPTNVEAQQATLSGGLDSTLDEIHEIRTQYQTAHGDQKDRLAERLEELTDELDTQLAVEKSSWMTDVAEVTDETFAWTLNIPEVILDGGFDIVIGNPPYEGQSQQDYIGELARFYDKKYDFYKTIPRMRHDLYQKFNIRGWELTREGGVLSYITSNTFYTIGSKLTTRKLFQKNKLQQLIRANPSTFDAKVNPAIYTLKKEPGSEEHWFAYVDAKGTDVGRYQKFIDDFTQPINTNSYFNESKRKFECVDFKNSTHGYFVRLGIYMNTLQNAFFKPTERNMDFYRTVMSEARSLYDRWSDEVRDSATVEDNLERIQSDHVAKLDPGDVSILGLLTLGGVGLHTGNNEEYIAYLDGTEAAERVRSRNDDFVYREKNENRYSWISRVIESDDIAEVAKLTEEEKLYGISGNRSVWVPVTKGKGKSFYDEPEEYINWSTNAVERIGETGLHRNRDFYFAEGIFAVGQGTGDPSFRYTDNCVIEHSGNILVPHTEKVSTMYLLGLLNSDLCHYLIDQFINHTVNTQLTDFRMLPVIIPTQEQMSRMESLVKDAIAIRVQENNVSDPMVDINPRNYVSLDQILTEIDELVIEIYGISER